MKKEYKYISVSGYTWSGSGAAVDLLKECKGIYVTPWEFRFVKDPHGLIDLDRGLNKPIDPLNQDAVIRDFLQFMHRYSKNGGGFRTYGLNARTVFGEDLYSISEEYIEKLTDYKYKGHWWYIDFYKPYLTYIVHKILQKTKLYDARTDSIMRLYQKSEEEFTYLTKEYINNIFASLLASSPEEYDTVVLDQGIPANMAGCAERYLPSSKVLAVDRDPRDIYVKLLSLYEKKKMMAGNVGYDVAMTHNVDLFVDWFKAYRKSSGEYVDDPKNVMKIRFEDLVLDYDRVSKDVLDFLEIPEERHVDKKKFLDPAISCKNIGTWKNFERPEEIEKLEKSLKQYLCHEVD